MNINIFQALSKNNNYNQQIVIIKVINYCDFSYYANHYFLYYADREGFGGVPKSAKQRMLENRQRQLASLNRMEEKLNRMDQRYSKFVKVGGWD